MNGWQPIDAAPKIEGRDVLVASVGGNTVSIAGWFAEWKYDARRPNAKDCWVRNGGYVCEPTHWMPLPEPPKA